MFKKYGTGLLAGLVVVLACLTFQASPASASTHWQRSNTAYYYVMNRCNDYAGCANLAYENTIYYSDHSYFLYTFTTRYCGRKYYHINIRDDYSPYGAYSYGGTC